MTIPRLKFEGDPYARSVTNIFAETLQDLLAKYEDGSGTFPCGFLHTSTLPHEGTQYYEQMWARDCGRGVIELARLGFTEQALAVSRYFLSHITFGSHWSREIHTPQSGGNELDGDALILLALANTWQANGCSPDIGREFLAALGPVADWTEAQIDASPYGGLLGSESELSGNPYTPTYLVYPIFGNYAMLVALEALAGLAGQCGEREAGVRFSGLAARLRAALSRLVSDGVYSYSPKGCWINAIDGRDGRAYDWSDWVGSSWPAYHWTRQLPFILDADCEHFQPGIGPAQAHRDSYADVHKWMCTGEYFRKYGFVSNSGWTGMAGRHDETMCGYGQGFFTQAALLRDDVNTYTKCMEGIGRLGYDGGVVAPLAFDMNPWVMHECFNYENYERGLDHTFGAMSEGRREVMDNPGDEGNLVQEAEIIKAIRLAAGVSSAGRRLVLAPRLPWTWDSLEALDYPVRCESGSERISFRFFHERWLRKCTVVYDVPKSFEHVDVRFGPFPRHLTGLLAGDAGLETCGGGSWIWRRDLAPGRSELTLSL